MSKQISFDQVFAKWMEAEINQPGAPKILELAKKKGFNSVTEWRLNTALKLRLDRFDWEITKVADPATELPEILVGPYQGWSAFFKNNFNTSFKQAMEIPEFYQWCQNHDRVIPISQSFPNETTLITLKKPDGKLIHIEGGHRICAVAFTNKASGSIDFSNRTVEIASAQIAEDDLATLQSFLTKGTSKQ